jgi:hypothetical protein
VNLETAEAQLRKALEADDRGALVRLEKVINELDYQPEPVSLHSAALYYASIGLHVFPLSPGTKVPFKGSGGCLDATTDTERINSWWVGNPQANVGIATGHAVDVVDIDGHDGQRSRIAHWEGIFERIDADALGKVLTPRVGGMHIYVPATGDGNATNIVPSVDVRGVGGYVVAPPSRTPQGRYRWLGTPDFTSLREEAVAS